MLRGRPLPAWSLVNWGYILFRTTLEWTYSTHAVVTSRLKLLACLCRLRSSDQPWPWWSSDQPRSTHGSVRCMQSNNCCCQSCPCMHRSFYICITCMYYWYVRYGSALAALWSGERQPHARVTPTATSAVLPLLHVGSGNVEMLLSCVGSGQKC
jgi:hypothetical protein